MNHLLLLSFACLIALPAAASLNYQEPVAEIARLAKAQLAPSVRVNSQGTAMLLLARSLYPPIATLSEPELRLGGLRVNPQKNIGSRVRYYDNIKIQYLNNRAGCINAERRKSKDCGARHRPTRDPKAGLLFLVTQ